MRRTILGAVIAASLGVPAVSFAAPSRGLNTNSPQPNQQLRDSPIEKDRVMRPFDQSANGTGATLGGGMQGGNESGHVTGPGNAPIDNSSRGPINDVQPGQGTNDTRQSKNPKPVY
ncbi:MAG TPA: hypothetical protein VF997_24345 [Polyangia bacterium]